MSQLVKNIKHAVGKIVDGMIVSLEPAPIRRVCLYHRNCFDGTAAAWVVLCAHPDTEVVAVDYNDKIYPDVCVGAEVLLVDFCYPEELMRNLICSAASVTVIDHHATSEPIVQRLADWTAGAYDFTVRHDQTMSGALLTYAFLYAEQFAAHGAPAPIRHVSDRDLWLFKDPATRNVMYSLGTFGYDPYEWRERFRNSYTPAMCENYKGSWERLDRQLHAEHLSRGEAIANYRETVIDGILSQTLTIHETPLGIIPVVNCPRAYASEVLGRLTGKHLFAASYYEADGLRHWSFRSTKGGFNVAVLAEECGGGGHPPAAGFVESSEQYRSHRPSWLATSVFQSVAA